MLDLLNKFYLNQGSVQLAHTESGYALHSGGGGAELESDFSDQGKK